MALRKPSGKGRLAATSVAYYDDPSHRYQRTFITRVAQSTGFGALPWIKSSTGTSSSLVQRSTPDLRFTSRTTERHVNLSL